MAKHDDDGGNDAGDEPTLEEGLGKAFDRISGGKDDDDDAADDRADDADPDDADDADPVEDDDEDPDADPDDDGEEDDEDDDPDDEDDDPDDDPEDDEDPLDPEVEAAAARHQLPTNFEDVVKSLPKSARAAARQAFAARLKDVESGLGRAFQEARAERQELVKLRARVKFDDEHRIDHIADLIDANPKLLEELNEELEQRETKAYREAKKMTRDRERSDLDKSAEQQVAAIEQRRQRGQQVSSLAQRLSRDAGVPFKLVDRAIYAAVMASDEKDITDEAIRRLVKQEARDWRKLTGERKQEKKKEYIQRKSKQTKDAKRRVSARDRGHAPAPGRRREPKSLEEALTRRAASILPDAPA